MTRRGAALRALVAGLGSLGVSVGCDNSQAFHTPDPGLERMLQQRRGDPYGKSEFFADGRVMRVPPKFSIAREARRDDDPRLLSGRDERGYVQELPLRVTRPLLEQGHAAFERVCANCHGVLGDGNSVVAEKMEQRKPPSLHEPRLAALAPGQTFEIISAGYGFMPSLSALLEPRERWAVVAYLGALRLSQAAPVSKLPATVRAELMRRSP